MNTSEEITVTWGPNNKTAGSRKKKAGFLQEALHCCKAIDHIFKNSLHWKKKTQVNSIWGCVVS